jgi:hypothetical protein
MNVTSCEPLNGTSTLSAVHQYPTGFAPDGVGFSARDPLLVTADSIQVNDLRVVRVLVRICLSRSLTHAKKDNLDDGSSIIRSTYTDIAPLLRRPMSF